MCMGSVQGQTTCGTHTGEALHTGSMAGPGWSHRPAPHARSSPQDQYSTCPRLASHTVCYSWGEDLHMLHAMCRAEASMCTLQASGTPIKGTCYMWHLHYTHPVCWIRHKRPVSGSDPACRQAPHHSSSWQSWMSLSPLIYMIMGFEDLIGIHLR